MKMIFQIKHTRSNNRNFIKTFAAFFLIAAVILIFIFSDTMRSLASDSLSIFFKNGNYFYDSINQISENFSSKNELIKENEKLLNQIENNRLDLINYESTIDENQKLREALGLKPIGNFVTANIIAKPPQIPLGTLFLDKGTEDNLKNRDLILAGERILIGKIVEISKHQSTVALNSFAEVISYGYVARTDEPLEIKGSGGNCIETKVPIDFDIVVGDKIIANGSPNFLIAVVGAVEEDRSSGLKKILLSLPVDISKTNLVFIKSYADQ